MPPKLFVICPIGTADSPAREKSDYVLEMIKEAAADKYDVHRHDIDNIDERITAGLMRALDTSAIVISYLGSQKDGGWNPNVMFETGYRLAVRRSLLILAHERDELPFDLMDVRHISLPSFEVLETHEARKQYIAKIREELLRKAQPSIQSSYAVAEILIDNSLDLTEDQRRRNCVFTMSSHAADRLFHAEPDGLAGMPITHVQGSLEPFVDRKQWQHFDREQHELLGRLILGHSDIIAKIPFIFRDDEQVHEDLRGGAFLAIIVQHRQLEQSLLLRLLYYRVPVESLQDGVCQWVNTNSLGGLPAAIRAARRAPGDDVAPVLSPVG